MTEITEQFEFKEKKWRTWLKGNWKLILKYTALALAVYFLFYLIWFYVSLPEVDYLLKKNPKITAIMQMRIDEAKEYNKPYKIRQRWVSFDQFPDLLKKAVRISEDASFYLHEGIDVEELKESIKKNLEEGKLARGGSTITQQLAKNLYLSTEKSFIRKIREYFITKRLENTLSKNRIFQLYLNIIELGPGVFGMEAAAEYYFGKDVSELSLEEIVRLTAIIPRPLITNPRGSSGWLKWKSRWILQKLKLYNYINEDLFNNTIVQFE